VAPSGVFCAPNAALRVNAELVLPPGDTALSTAIQARRAEQQQASELNKHLRALTAVLRRARV
jgi:hypothetical protein